MCDNDPNGAPEYYFVWVRSHSGPQPQKWTDIGPGVGNWKEQIIIKKWPLSTERALMSLDELKVLYPISDWNKE